ncbi:GNAT family N-acetyltransferase [Microbispora triticiradicis]|uniref:GNAT family N-acetyltransferase n=1 Tax=Microbispora triticiradicis TaxID=2200763 RepID=UPI001AD73BCD|nr:GNAT family N-acetyltransferase [Microbispora triticiradicis]MBO4274970.1 GNAT family N-acetyltransferase [Microbispora triticiradicis]
MIGQAEPADLAALPEIERAADGVFAPLGIVFPPGTTVVEECDDPARVIVAGRPPVGFALLGVVDGLTHLEQIAVRPGHANQGIGTRLLEAVCAITAMRAGLAARTTTAARTTVDPATIATHTPAARATVAAVTLTTFRDVPWNAPWYARRGFRVIQPHEWGPELSALVEHERALGIEVAPRVVMRKDL